MITDEEIERIAKMVAATISEEVAEKAAEKALEKVYAQVGRSVLKKASLIIGALVIAALVALDGSKLETVLK